MGTTLEIVKIKAEKYSLRLELDLELYACAMPVQALFLQLPDVGYLSPIVHLYTISNVQCKPMNDIM